MRKDEPGSDPAWTAGEPRLPREPLEEPWRGRRSHGPGRLALAGVALALALVAGGLAVYVFAQQRRQRPVVAEAGPAADATMPPGQGSGGGAARPTAPASPGSPATPTAPPTTTAPGPRVPTPTPPAVATAPAGSTPSSTSMPPSNASASADAPASTPRSGSTPAAPPSSARAPGSPSAAPAAADPKSPRSLLSQARRLRDRGEVQKALDAYGRVLETEPENVEALAGRGWCYLDLSRYAPAEASFEAALQVAPDHPDATMGLAETYRYEGRRSDAVRYYERYLAAHPEGEDAVAARNALTQLQE